MTDTHDAETVERVAKAINGPHDPTHIGQDRLIELQDYRWEHQTDSQSRNFNRSQARAALSALPAPKVKPLEWHGGAEMKCENLLFWAKIYPNSGGNWTLDNGEYLESFDSPNDAKDAAQRQYEARILGALV